MNMLICGCVDDIDPLLWSWVLESTATATDTHFHTRSHARTRAPSSSLPITNQEVGSILGRTVPGSAGIRVRLQLQLATPGDSFFH